MKFMKMVVIMSALAAGLSAQVDTNSQDYYMFVYFINANGGEELGARLAFSTDGINWQPYNNEAPVIVPEVTESGAPLMRDPNIYYDSTTGVFHLTWTTQWTQTNIGYATSTDLVHWSEQVMIHVGKKIQGCACCWAPEFFYDDIKDSVMVFWSTERGTIGKEAFYCMTKDFRYFSTPQVYFSPKTVVGGSSEWYSVIDETILKVATNKYYLFCKDERISGTLPKQTQNIHFVVGPTPQGPWWKGPWDDVSNPISVVGREGPTAIVLGDQVLVYSDPFREVGGTDRIRKISLAECLAAEPPASASWVKGDIMKTATGNFLPSHGSISKIPRAKVMQILYGIPDKTVYRKSFRHPKQNQIYVGDLAGYVPVPDDTGSVIEADYPLGKQNMGCGTGFGLALLIPFGLKGVSLRRRRNRKSNAR